MHSTSTLTSIDVLSMSIFFASIKCQLLITISLRCGGHQTRNPIVVFSKVSAPLWCLSGGLFILGHPVFSVWYIENHTRSEQQQCSQLCQKISIYHFIRAVRITGC